MTILLGIALLVPIVLLGTSLADNFARFAGEMLSVFEKGLPPPPPWVAELPYVGSTLSDAWLYFAGDTTRFADTARQYVGPTTQWLLGLGTKLGGGILDLTLSVIAAFFFSAMAPMGRNGSKCCSKSSGRTRASPSWPWPR